MSSIKRRLLILCMLTFTLLILATLLNRDTVENKTQQKALEGERQIFHPPENSHLTSLTVKSRAGSFALGREISEAAVWTLRRPENLLAEETTVESIVAQVIDLQALGEVGVDPNNATKNTARLLQASAIDANLFGFAHPAQSICLGYQKSTGAAEEVLCLELGDINSFDQTLFLRRKGEGRIFRVDKTLAQTLDVDLYSLRDKRLVRLAPESITALEVTKQGHRLYRLERKPKHFDLDAPAGARADPILLGNILSAVTQMRGARFFDLRETRAHPEPMGLDPPALRVRIERGQQEAVSVDLGRITLGGQVHIFARTESPDRVTASLPSDYAFDQLNQLRTSLRERHLLPDLIVKDVASVTITEPNHAFILTSSSASPTGKGPVAPWRLRHEGEEVQADGEAVVAFITAIHAIKTEAILKEPATPNDLRTYHLDRQIREIALFDKAGATLGILYLGKEVDADRMALTTDARTRIDAVTSQMGRILKAHADTFRADRRVPLAP